MATNRAAIDPVGYVDSLLCRLGIVESDCITFAIRGDDVALGKRRQDAANLRQEIFDLVKTLNEGRRPPPYTPTGETLLRNIRADLARDPIKKMHFSEWGDPISEPNERSYTVEREE